MLCSSGTEDNWEHNSTVLMFSGIYWRWEYITKFWACLQRFLVP